jgi:hypothetical protein
MTLGAGQIALLDKLGFPVFRSSSARANPNGGTGTDKPTKLLTIYVPGGWFPVYLWCPLNAAEIASHIPPKTISMKSPVYFTADEVENLDGSGNAPGEAGFQRLRSPVQWNEEALAAGLKDPINNGATSPNGWAWRYYKLWENATVVHGIDQGTAAHQSARISAMCGVPGAVYKSPAMHAIVANALSAVYADTRPLGSVSIGKALVPNPGNLPPVAAPTLLPSLNELEYTLSERIDKAWAGLRNRTPHAQVDFQGNPLANPIGTNDMDERALADMRALAGTTNSATDAFYERLYNTYQGVSKQLAADLVTTIEGTPGAEFNAVPYWISDNWSYFGTSIGQGVSSDSGGTWKDDFDLALKLLKSDLTSAISLYAPGIKDFYFDTHGAGHTVHLPYLRSAYDVIGRLLAEMKSTPIGGGKTLLDDTQVLIFSEFSRTWPKSGTCDHWPTTSVCFAGGNVAPNRMIGGYDLSVGSPTNIGFTGKSISLINEGGTPLQRPPISADVVYTVLDLMGLNNVFIPGGPGRIVGVKQA